MRELREEIGARDVTDKDRTISELRKVLKKAHEDLTAISKGLQTSKSFSVV